MSFRSALVFALLGLLAPAPAHAWCVGGAPPALDPDDEGLNNLQEDFFGTDPGAQDGDGDGISDGDEDNDGDGIANKDEPTIFSLEGFVDPFANPRRNVALVIEGTNLLPARTGTRVTFLSTGKTFRIRRRFSNQVRLYVLMRPEVAETAVGSLKITTRVGDTNALSFMPMHCEPGPPMLMGAAELQLSQSLNQVRHRLDYVAIGGCNLVSRVGPYALTRVRLIDHDIELIAPWGGIGMLPSRVIVPAHSQARPDPIYPFNDDIRLGDMVRVVTPEGVSQPVAVASRIAELRIPVPQLYDDHDQDGLNTADEVEVGTDPLVYDTDHDKLNDADEVLRGNTDPLDPDSDDDGVLDGDE